MAARGPKIATGSGKGSRSMRKGIDGEECNGMEEWKRMVKIVVH